MRVRKRSQVEEKASVTLLRLVPVEQAVTPAGMVVIRLTNCVLCVLCVLCECVSVCVRECVSV